MVLHILYIYIRMAMKAYNVYNGDAWIDGLTHPLNHKIDCHFCGEGLLGLKFPS